MSTQLGRVSGKPYDRDTFEVRAVIHSGVSAFNSLTFQPREPDSASDSSDEEDQEHFSRKKDFHLGRFCANRTVAFHKFMHWEVSP
jgi:hypothetical protein